MSAGVRTRRHLGGPTIVCLVAALAISACSAVASTSLRACRCGTGLSDADLEPLRAAARDGDGRAALCIAYELTTSEGSSTDWELVAAIHGEESARLYVAERLVKEAVAAGRDPSAGLVLLEGLATTDPRAMMALAEVHMDVLDERSTGLVWLRKAAEHGGRFAALRLAEAYIGGPDRDRHDVELLAWLRIAQSEAPQGTAMSNRITKMYEEVAGGMNGQALERAKAEASDFERTRRAHLGRQQTTRPSWVESCRDKSD